MSDQEKTPAPKCPYCGTQPVRFHIQTGPVPLGTAGAQAIVTQIFCANPECSKVLPMLITGVIPPPGGEGIPEFAQQKGKMWTPPA